MCDNASMNAADSSIASHTASHRQPLRGWLLLIAANVIFAGAYVSGKFALATVSPVTLNALRFVLASAILAPVVARGWRQLRMDRADLLTFVGVSVLSFVLNKLFEYLGVNLSTASDSALLISGEGICTAALAWGVLRERASWLHVGALFLGSFGAYLIVERGLLPHLTGAADARRIFGDALFLLSLVFEAIASITSKRLAGRFSPLLVTAATVIGSLAVWIPAGVVDIALHGLRLTALSIGGVVYLAVFVTVIGYFFWFAGLQVIDGAAAAATLFIQPLVGTLLAIWLTHDTLTPFTIIGGACIIASVWAISRLNTRAPLLAPPAE
jgi:drug/metabolite transporter (DMT)-like permease